MKNIGWNIEVVKEGVTAVRCVGEAALQALLDATSNIPSTPVYRALHRGFRAKVTYYDSRPEFVHWLKSYVASHPIEHRGQAVGSARGGSWSFEAQEGLTIVRCSDKAALKELDIAAPTAQKSVIYPSRHPETPHKLVIYDSSPQLTHWLEDYIAAHPVRPVSSAAPVVPQDDSPYRTGFRWSTVIKTSILLSLLIAVCAYGYLLYSTIHNQPAPPTAPEIKGVEPLPSELVITVTDSITPAERAPRAISNDTGLAATSREAPSSPREVARYVSNMEPNGNLEYQEVPDAYARWRAGMKLFLECLLLLAYLTAVWGISSLAHQKNRLVGAIALGAVAAVIFGYLTEPPNIWIDPPITVGPGENSDLSQMPAEVQKVFPPSSATSEEIEIPALGSVSTERRRSESMENHQPVFVAARPQPAYPYPLTTRHTTTTTVYPTIYSTRSTPEEEGQAKPRSTPGPPHHEDREVNINTADIEELKHIHGVSDHYAPIIYQERERNGKYLNANDVNYRVKGLGRHVDWSKVRF